MSLTPSIFHSGINSAEADNSNNEPSIKSLLFIILIFQSLYLFIIRFLGCLISIFVKHHICGTQILIELHTMPKLTIGAKGVTQCVTQCMLNDYPGLSEVVHPSHCNLYVQNKHVKQSTAVLQ